MIIVALSHSIWRAWREKSVLRRRFGLFLDVALVLAGLIISGTYLVELEAVCLLDVITGDRARLIAEALQSEVEYSELMGLPVPETADDPSCLNNTGGWFAADPVWLGTGFSGLQHQGMGPAAGSYIDHAIASYTFLTVMNWYVFGADGQNKYLVTILSSEEVRSLTSGREFVRDALVNNTAGLLGRFINILMLLVFPYIILGALFGRCAGGQALIKLGLFGDPQYARWSGACSGCVVRHVWHHHRRACCQRAVDGVF